LAARKPLVVSDADNTLWDTDSVYRKAQLALFDTVNKRLGLPPAPFDRLLYLRRLDEEIASHHPLRWRYPPRFLIAALAHALSRERSPNSTLPKETQTVLDEDTIAELEHRFLHALNADIPLLRESVLEGVSELYEIGAVIVLATEANADRCRALLEFHHLQRYITSVQSAVKTPTFFRSIANEYGGLRGPRFMVGDQLDRDIAPAKAAGFVTVLFAGGFKPAVENNHHAKPDFVMTKYSQLPAIVSSFNPLPKQYRHARSRS
jgi:putative hydrolase of the HAD superfamily